MVFLGLSLDLQSRLIYLTNDKVDSYLELLRSVVSGEAGESGGERCFAAFDSFKSQAVAFRSWRVFLV